MKIIGKMKVALMLFATIASCGSVGSKRPVADFNPLERLISRWIDRNYYPGAAIAVADKDGVIYENYYGDYSSETVVAVASAGKWIAAATVAAAVDKTPLTWDDTIEEWIPEFQNDPKGKIPLRALLSHTSGIPPYPDQPAMDTHNCLDSAVNDILPMHQRFLSGSRFQYGGLAMQIAGRMVEVASGTDFNDFFMKHLATPLGMKHSSFTPVGLDSGHNPMLGGGFRTTLSDYMHFLDMIFHDGRYGNEKVLSEEAVHEMEENQIGDAVIESGEYVERALGLRHHGIYGLGLWREKVDDSGNAYQISSPGWAGAYPWINRKDGIYGFFLSHVEGNSAARDNFSPFYNAPEISETVTKIINNSI